MKKEWWIISALVVVIIVLSFMYITKGENDLFNQNLRITNLLKNTGGQCDDILNNIERVADGLNHCNIDSDCAKKSLGMLDSCGGHLLNKDEKLENLNNEILGYKNEGCTKPIDDCSKEDGTLRCVDKKCMIDSSVKQLLKTNSTTNTSSSSGKTCTNDAQCPYGEKCWDRGCGTLNVCATPAEISKGYECLPNN